MQMREPIFDIDSFARRHIGPNEEEVGAMLRDVGFDSLGALIDATVPKDIRLGLQLNLPQAKSEGEALAELRAIAQKNKIARSFIGAGYYDSITPPVIQRNILENPGWYTAYTPYQAEVAQGRLEALLNFQQMIIDLTALDIANASMLDEATAAAEAMTLCHAVVPDRKTFFVADNCHPQTIAVVQTRAKPLGIEIKIGDYSQFKFDSTIFGALVQYPATDGAIYDYAEFVRKAHDAGALVVVAADILALTLLKPPGEFGADVAVGNTQRFGVPLGFGGPHAAYFATRDEFKRHMPGRLVGVSHDAEGRPAYRLALQTREQHIRRDKATSNICTAEVLLAVIASMYAVYHGPKGLRAIAERIHRLTSRLADGLRALGCTVTHENFFDTVRVEVESSEVTLEHAAKAGCNLRGLGPRAVGISFDETTTPRDIELLMSIFRGTSVRDFDDDNVGEPPIRIPQFAIRTSEYLTHPIFNTHDTETEMLRYLKKLESRDLSLTTSMIPLGSCTMKLNATAEMFPISWPEISKLHPFAPSRTDGGLHGNFPATGRLAGGNHRLRRGFIATECRIAGRIRGSAGHSRISCIARRSASQRLSHSDIGTRHESSQRDNGRIQGCVGRLLERWRHRPCRSSRESRRTRARSRRAHGDLSINARRIRADDSRNLRHRSRAWRPGLHGRREHERASRSLSPRRLRRRCLSSESAQDVLHPTRRRRTGRGTDRRGQTSRTNFCRPTNIATPNAERPSVRYAVGPVAAAPWGSASILTITWMYIRMMGAAGLKRASEVAILNANYIAKRLDPYFPVLFKGKHGLVAHECIIDLRQWKSAGIEVEDVAKRLMDYGFHAPTVSWPVGGTMMIEPTESEPKHELDRFCDAMISIHAEMQAIADGKQDRQNNLLKNAPHTARQIASDKWDRPYSREQAAFPAPWTRDHKFWPAVARIDNVYGDRNLFCSCPPVEEFEKAIARGAMLPALAPGHRREPGTRRSALPFVSSAAADRPS